ncbi:hypothetical protein [Halorussus salinus]|uniref:hypothetical protein n=1 Tax=Halorussus salinus TaxID=1364935 RepID=UPI00109226A7|nr:hypothetical protein [Halorussus salinus]
MTDETRRVTVRSRWATGVELGVLGWPATFGAVGLGFFVPGLGVESGEFAETLALLAVLSLVVGVALRLLLAVTLYFDATRVYESDADWDPSPVVYALGGLFLASLTGLVYLLKRHDYVEPPAVRGGWWYGVGGAFAAMVLVPTATLLVGSTGIQLSNEAMATFPEFGLSLLLCGVLPIAIYKDAVYVRATDRRWSPNPVVYLLGTFVTAFLPVVPAVVSGYYLYKRHEHVGTP